MISVTVLSPNSTTLWSSCRSPRWMTPSSAPRLKTLLSSSSVRPGRFSPMPMTRRTPLVNWTQRAATGARTRIIQVSGTAIARETETGEAAPIALGISSAKMKSVSVETRTATKNPERSPKKRVARFVADAEAALMKRFWAIRITARSFAVCALKLRINIPRRSPFSRMPCRSIRESETSAVSDPAKKAENAVERRKATP